VTNEAPYFSVNQLKNQNVPVGLIKTYSLPSLIDKEKLQVKCLVKEQNKASLPSFVEFDEKLNMFTI